ncbi:glycosyltransferase family 2 protein [Draconibacterium halophilum]|uniref:Glycosyltransferase family 2 protein n=1 Tax=Draconibacterium halophilum TaxID=2706887 RepID=A0A6C0R953_9BACT|nr:glycosyltransferase family 2 protein [Draconibacterium halophilum]QIA06719.1 glycosyltransferase family 2 protein [Draconibacterium halophilum]
MVSVIIPTYNRAEFIEYSICSVLNQTYSNLELIVVDDCSTDNTEEIVNGIEDDRLRYIKLDKNSGACYARNFGIKNANYDLIAFHDSDDLWYADKLEKQVKLLDQLPADYGMVFCSLKRDYGNAAIVPPLNSTKTSGEIFKNLLNGNFISTQTMLCRKSIFSKIGYFDNNLPAFQDWDLVIRIAKKYKIKHLRECLVEVRISDDSISLNHAKRLDAFQQIIEKYKNEIPKQILKDWFYEAGYIAMKANQKDKTKALLGKAIDLYSIRGITALKKLIFYLLK